MPWFLVRVLLFPLAFIRWIRSVRVEILVPTRKYLSKYTYARTHSLLMDHKKVKIKRFLMLQYFRNSIINTNWWDRFQKQNINIKLNAASNNTGRKRKTKYNQKMREKKKEKGDEEDFIITTYWWEIVITKIVIIITTAMAMVTATTMTIKYTWNTKTQRTIDTMKWF